MIPVNIAAAALAAFLAVLVGVKIKDIGVRTYIVVLVSAVLLAASIVEAWFSDSSVIKSAAIGWIIGYITDDILLTFNTVLPNFVTEVVNNFFDWLKRLVNKWLS